MTNNTNDVYCIDKVTGQRCDVNAKVPRKISNEYLDLDLMFLMRDGQHGYFEGKKRRFDLQCQFQLKQPVNTIWYGIELDESLELGTVQKMMAKAGLVFCQKMNPDPFHSQISKEPCMVFQVDKNMDRIAQTQPGDIPPCLGEAIEESPESIQKRAKHVMDWNTDDTYTLSCFSSYFDFMSWSCMSLPVLPSFDATKLVGDQSLRVASHILKDETKGHVASNKIYVFNLETSNPSKTSLGPAAREWIRHNSNDSKKTPALLQRAFSLASMTSYGSDWSGQSNLDNDLDHCAQRTRSSSLRGVWGEPGDDEPVSNS